MHIKLSLRICVLCLALLLLPVSLLSCGNTATPDTPSADSETRSDPVSSETDKPDLGDTVRFTVDELKTYKLVRSDNLNTGDPILSVAVSFMHAINDATGANFKLGNDWVDKKNPADTSGILEILVGPTNRDAEVAIMDTLGSSEFFIGISGPKIIVTAADSFGMQKALEWFFEHVLKQNADGTFPKLDALDIPEHYVGTFESPMDLYIIDDALYKNNGGNDMVRFYSTLQGLENRAENVKRNNAYIYQMHDSQDGFWLNYLSQPGKMFSYVRHTHISTLDQLLNYFGEDIKQMGMVLWDPQVAATSNVAATIAGVEGCLPVKFDEATGTLYSKLLAYGVPVKFNLVGLFEGARVGGKIADTNLDSTGSSKCDAYLWAMDQYLDKCAVDMVAYVLDGAGTLPDNYIYQTAQQTSPEYNQVFSHDYLVMNKCFFFDLTLVADEAPCDDPDQPMGTDARTLNTLLQAFYTRAGGNIVTVMGFPMWWMKYTTFLDHGKTPATTLEWDFVELITTYNCMKEADAAHPAWMTNGSVYTQYELDFSTIQNNNESMYPDMEFDEDTRYFTIYLGDYDSGAWLKQHVPEFFKDSKRGALPLMWGFNPNLSRRVPMVFQYVYENLSEKDVVVTGDSGAGYVIPSALVNAAKRNGRPNGASKWIEFCKEYMPKFQMDMVGFIINGNNRMTNEIFEMYNQIAPAGSFHNDNSAEKRLTVYKGVVYMHLQNGINPAGGEETYASMLRYIEDYNKSGRKSSFAAYRTVCKSPSEIWTCVNGFIEYAEAHSDYNYVYVDPYTLFNLVLDSGQGVIVRD